MRTQLGSLLKRPSPTGPAAFLLKSADIGVSIDATRTRNRNQRRGTLPRNGYRSSAPRSTLARAANTPWAAIHGAGRGDGSEARIAMNCIDASVTLA